MGTGPKLLPALGILLPNATFFQSSSCGRLYISEVVTDTGLRKQVKKMEIDWDSVLSFKAEHDCFQIEVWYVYKKSCYVLLKLGPYVCVFAVEQATTFPYREKRLPGYRSMETHRPFRGRSSVFYVQVCFVYPHFTMFILFGFVTHLINIHFIFLGGIHCFLILKF